MYNALLLLLTVAACATAAIIQDDGEHNITTHWMELPLDHFNLFDNRTWKMRYFVNSEFFEPGKPLFLYIGGEGPIDTRMLVNGQLYRLAKKHHGLMVTTEHRYYGESQPFGKDYIDLDVEDFKYLQMEQALEDLAYFIDHYKAMTPGLKDSIVVVHGCSYPGMLATWVRLRFPHLVDIAYASSAPLGVGLNYPEFFEIVYDAYANVSSQCIDTIKEGFKITQELLKSKLGRKTVRDALRKWGCGNIDKMNSAEIIGKMQSLLNTMYDPVKYEEIGCVKLSEDDLSAFHKLANFIVMKSVDQQSCLDEEDPTGDSFRSGISWKYQTCTEQGTFQTLDRKNARNPFAVDLTLEESVEDCVDTFGGIVTEDVLKAGIERVTRRYGGKRPKVTKVVTAQGTHDPWKHLATLEDYNAEAPVFLIRGMHCVDITESEEDPPELWETRKKIRDIVSKWIEEIS